MPANIAHMLIAHKALQKLKAKGVEEYTAFAELIDGDPKDNNYKAYVNLGSLGPDLYYYSSLVRAARDMLVDGYVQAAGVVPWSYHLHSHQPNRFPLALVKVLFRDAVWKRGKVDLQDDDVRKLAYIAGHLTHIAADQIIHPVVNEVAGPYYRSGENRKTHRECEVFQDYFLYHDVYRLEEKTGSEYDFFEQDFRAWADCVTGLTFRNTEDWFRYFLQRAFAETYGVMPSEGDIEDGVDNLLLTLRACKKVGPYRKAAKEFDQDGEGGKLYRRYVKDVNYVRHYRLAVELSVVYLIALYEVYARLVAGEDFTDQHEARFLAIVRGADLSAPLEKDILAKASEALVNESTMDSFLSQRTSEYAQQVELLAPNQILQEGSEADVVKA